MNRLDNAEVALVALLNDLRKAINEPDPVEQRSRQVHLAKKLRLLGDYLDDNGRLTAGYET